METYRLVVLASTMRMKLSMRSLSDEKNVARPHLSISTPMLTTTSELLLLLLLLFVLPIRRPRCDTARQRCADRSTTTTTTTWTRRFLARRM